MPLMTLGLFVFETTSLAYQEVARRTEWRFAETERLGQMAALQFLGPGKDTLSLPGILYPGQIGTHTSLLRLRAMADTGEAHQMMTGSGEVAGDWIIRSIDEKHSVLLDDGSPRKIDFTLELERFEP